MNATAIGRARPGKPGPVRCYGPAPAMPGYWTAVGALDFGVHVALAATGCISRDQERQMTLTLRLKDGAC
jgi:hypothetical protein